jgi:hypothetical protein
MTQRISMIAAIVLAAALTGTLSTAPIIVYADESETDTDQENKQKNVGSGNSFNNNCAENIDPPPPGQLSFCTGNNQPSGPPVDVTSTETATETDITTNPLFNLADLFDFSTTLPQ